MDIRPQDLPELRVEAAQWQAANEGRMLIQWAEVVEDYQTLLVASGYDDRKNREEFARYLWRAEATAIANAELFFASGEMTALAQAASEGLPSFCIRPEDLPAETGLILFEGGISKALVYDDDASGVDAKVQAVTWSTPVNGDLAGGVHFTPYVLREILVATLQEMPDGESAARNASRGPRLIALPAASFGSPFGESGWTELPDHAAVAGVLPTLLSAFLLMQQSLAEVSEVAPDRAARKRLRRINQEPAAVRVIELRRPKHTSGEPADSGRNYVHRWITRGHWRQQWYATRQVHRPVWIAPHVKGPEGAPMIGGEKVYAWKR